MREIKFRGRSTHSDNWCYGSFINNPDEPTICGFDIWADGDSDWREEKVEPHTVGQFTGLHDKNGKEIYEGDIICSPRGNKHYIVYDENNGSYAAVRIGEKPEDGMCSITKYWIEHYEKEVIGNIHDNPELLKGGEK